MNAGPAANSSRRRNQSLDLLRGIAILMVMLAHCALATTSVVPGLAAAAGKYGQFGVELFFIVSGYTMMLTFGDRVDLAAAGAFYIRRAFRIAPLFWIALVAYLAITKGEGFREWAPDGVSTSDVVLTFFFLHWTSVTAFNSVVPGGWSIAVEMQFYLLFPLIIGLFRRDNGPLVIYALIALVSASGQFVADHYLVPQLSASLSKDGARLAYAFFYCSLPHQLICFGFGILYDIVNVESPNPRCAVPARSLPVRRLGRGRGNPVLHCTPRHGQWRQPVLDDPVRYTPTRSTSLLRPDLGGQLAPADGSVPDVSAGRRPVIGVELLRGRTCDRASFQQSGYMVGTRLFPKSQKGKLPFKIIVGELLLPSLCLCETNSN
jgi:hypothetical protein